MSQALFEHRVFVFLFALLKAHLSLLFLVIKYQEFELFLNKVFSKAYKLKAGHSIIALW